MIWATVGDVQVFWAEQQAAYGADAWPALPSTDGAVRTLITSASRVLAAKVIRWPVVDDDDRAEDTEQRAHMVAAVCHVIRVSRRAAAQDAALSGLSDVVAAGGSITAGNLSVWGGRGARVGDRADRVPVDAVFALSDAGLIGGGVATW